jgi:hypothetical protein
MDQRPLEHAIRQGVIDADGTPVTLVGDDAQARGISLERLLSLGLAHRGVVYPHRRLLHRWALFYARDKLTNYDEVVRHLPRSEVMALQRAVGVWALSHWPSLELER